MRSAAGFFGMGGRAPAPSYIPIAQSESAVALRLEDDNYGNLDVAVDDAPVLLDGDITVDASTTRCVKVAFSSADGISIAADFIFGNDDACFTNSSIRMAAFPGRTVGTLRR